MELCNHIGGMLFCIELPYSRDWLTQVPEVYEQNGILYTQIENQSWSFKIKGISFY